MNLNEQWVMLDTGPKLSSVYGLEFLYSSFILK